MKYDNKTLRNQVAKPRNGEMDSDGTETDSAEEEPGEESSVELTDEDSDDNEIRRGQLAVTKAWFAERFGDIPVEVLHAGEDSYVWKTPSSNWRRLTWRTPGRGQGKGQSASSSGARCSGE